MTSLKVLVANDEYLNEIIQELTTRGAYVIVEQSTLHTPEGEEKTSIPKLIIQSDAPRLLVSFINLMFEEPPFYII